MQLRLNRGSSVINTCFRGRRTFQSSSRREVELDEKLPDIEPWVIHDLRRAARSLTSRAGVLPHGAVEGFTTGIVTTRRKRTP